MKNPHFRCWAPFLFTFAFLLAACAENMAAETPEAATSSTPTKIHATNTPPPPSITPSPTFEALSSEEAQARVDELLETNGGCEYPCWWGIKPGETSFHDTVAILDPLSYDSSINNTNYYLYYFADITIPESIYVTENLSIGVFNIKYLGELADYIEIRGYYLPIKDILLQFGIPDEVYFECPLIFPTTLVPYSIFLDYRNQGIIVIHFSDVTTPNPEDEIIICELDRNTFQKGSEIFTFWNPERKLTSYQYFLIDTDSYVPDYYPIELFSNMDAEAFFKNFTSPNPGCLVIDTYLYGFQSR